jgi:hypothetical protein
MLRLFSRLGLALVAMRRAGRLEHALATAVAELRTQLGPTERAFLRAALDAAENGEGDR